VLHTLARDLGSTHPTDLVSQILGYCDRRVEKFLAEFPGDVQSLDHLLDLVAAKVRTCFRIVCTDADLQSIQDEFLKRNETAFANLPRELGPEVFGITFRLQHRAAWELPFVSVIDCRREKNRRAHFTKWHELAHLLTLTSQTRLAFRRTHIASILSPEESMMDIIAGRFAFYHSIIGRYARGQISFDNIENLREQLCPEASKLSSLIGIAKAWASPCLLITAELAVRKGERAQLRQQGFAFSNRPEYKLRATRVKANEVARRAGFKIFENMRVPERSVVYRVFTQGIRYGYEREDLSWWTTSDGTLLETCPVLIEARLTVGDYVEALVSPLNGVALN
jgi:hypothetical protein